MGKNQVFQSTRSPLYFTSPNKPRGVRVNPVSSTEEDKLSLAEPSAPHPIKKTSALFQTLVLYRKRLSAVFLFFARAIYLQLAHSFSNATSIVIIVVVIVFR
jgi:hypothetical protein